MSINIHMNIGNENYYNHTHTMNFKSILQLLTIYVCTLYVCIYIRTVYQSAHHMPQVEHVL